MRIAIVSDYYYPQLGGITEHVHGQATELARRGHDVTVLTPRARGRAEHGRRRRPARTGNFDLVHVGRAFPFYANGARDPASPSAAGLPFALDPRLRARPLRRRPRAQPVRRDAAGHRDRALAARRSTVGTFHSVVPERYRPCCVLAPAAAPSLPAARRAASASPTRSSTRCSRSFPACRSRRSRTGSTPTSSRPTRSRCRARAASAQSSSSAASTRETASST